MMLETALLEYAQAMHDCQDSRGEEHEAAKDRLHKITDQIAEIEAISPAELVAKFDVLRDAIPFRGMRWDDLRAYRLVASVKKDAERLIAQRLQEAGVGALFRI
jgi:hypothetical protein